MNDLPNFYEVETELVHIASKNTNMTLEVFYTRCEFDLNNDTFIEALGALKITRKPVTCLRCLTFR